MINHYQEHFEFTFSKDETIHSSTAPKSHVKLINQTNIYNRFYIIIAIVFTTKNKISGLVIKYEYIVVYFCLVEGWNIPPLHLKYLWYQSEKFLFTMEQDKQKNHRWINHGNLKIKNLQHYTTTFEIEYIKYELNPDMHQLSTTFQFKTE